MDNVAFFGGCETFFAEMGSLVLRLNWFDKKYGDCLQQSSPSQFLQQLAKDPRLIDAVELAMSSHELHESTRVVGPSISQMVRRALADALQAET